MSADLFRFNKHAKFWLSSITVALIVLLSLAPGCGKKQREPAPAARESLGLLSSVAHITDIHFNPFYDSTLSERLLNSDASQWEEIFASSRVSGFGILEKNETNYNLLASSLKSMASTDNAPGFIIFTGDFLAHEFNEKFKDNGGQEDQYEGFVDKTLTFMTLMFEKYFPGVPVYISLGNNDSYAGDYRIVPDGDFLHNSAPILASHLLKNPANRESFGKTYTVGGYFTAEPPGGEKQGTRIIALNSIFFSVKHPGGTDYDPAEKELTWLESQLKEARLEKRKVWLLLHIPPGTNVYTTLRKQAYTSMWKTDYNLRFIRLLEAYGAEITAAFAGHTHMDDFRLLLDSRDSGKAVSFVRIGPAVSPQFGNNPAYELLSCNLGTFSLKNYTLYYLDLDSGDSDSVQWQKEYDYAQTYGPNAFTAATLLTVYNAMETEPRTRGYYMTYYNVSRTSRPALTDDNFHAYWCGIADWTQSDFENCQGKE